MHKSEEITEVNKVLNEQLKVLGLRDDLSNVDIRIIQAEEKKIISYSFLNIMNRLLFWKMKPLEWCMSCQNFPSAKNDRSF